MPVISRSPRLLGLIALLFAPGLQADTLHTVEVLGVYPPFLTSRVADPEALFVSNIEYANRALRNSEANFRYNLVGVVEIGWEVDDTVGEAQLISLSRNAAIRQLREDYGADLVSGMTGASDLYCGIAFLLPGYKDTQTFYWWVEDYAYSLINYRCRGRTLAHELGHNLGLGHSPAQGGVGGLADWARGWGKEDSFVTIMAYESAYWNIAPPARLQVFSNPALMDCVGQPCGRSITAPDGADATSGLNLASVQAAEWRDSVLTLRANNPPIAVEDIALTDSLSPVTIEVLNNDTDPDGDAISISAVSAPQFGDARILNGDTQVLYAPSAGFVGQDFFRYVVIDGRGATAEAQVTVDVTASQHSTTNLVINGDAEAGLHGWTGGWGMTLSVSNNAISGNSSIYATGGTAVFVDLQNPITGNRNLSTTGWLSATDNTTAFVYLLLRQGGVWRYNYVTSVTLPRDTWVNFDVTRYIDGPEITGAHLMIYQPEEFKQPIYLDNLAVRPR